jgi:hypothetical protein
MISMETSSLNNQLKKIIKQMKRIVNVQIVYMFHILLHFHT